ncbi:heme exporter protein CcmD [Aeromonas molluscorum]|uniref:Heme exporter protein D n=1 Tax=Aeromonas molluscorum 848 TaxID=1268236 RepID=R1GQA4_9GAMM|nr:heme exporter protein CcmD [Aeromonas molluscorum]EOD53885.1 hypothetical protein G113_17213 [Aeromonas molluscorum 848]
MHFSSLSEFLAMGGYGFYVWLSFGLSWLCLVGIIVTTRIKHRTLLSDLRNKQARESRRLAAQQMENTL